MTTIATDGKTIAADTRMIGQYIESGHAEKMIQTLGGGGVKTTLAGAGAYAKVRKFFDWYRNGQDAESYPEDDSDYNQFLAVSDGKFYSYEGYYKPIEISPPIAIGSGGSFAMGAMLNGASPKEAVEIAMKLDPNTGGNIIVFEV